MNKKRDLIHKGLQQFLIVTLPVAIALGLRYWPLGSIGPLLAWLTFYPAVMVVAVMGGFVAGLLSIGLACLIALYAWPFLLGNQPISSTPDLIGMSVFILNGVFISAISEAMRRARERARQSQVQAEAANHAKSMFLANMSHELRTPLNAILGFSGLMLNDVSVPEATRKMIDIINRSGEHLLKLINSVLDIARIESGHMDIDITSFDVRAMMRDITDLMRPRAEEKGLELALDQAPDVPCLVRTDDVKLHQIIINLLGNAIKYTECGTVALRIGVDNAESAQRRRLVIEVKDTGIGIGARDQKHIFVPFFQSGEVSKRNGTGLGLAITRQYTELMGGDIGVKSAPGEGSIFTINLPFEIAEESEMIGSEPGRRKVVGLVSGQPERRILIVEDNETNWLLLKQILENAGLQVLVANNGAEGVKLFQTWKPHFIWMDCRMPVMDGLEATQCIRSLDGGQDVIIVALTASVFKDEHDNILAAGMNDFMQKPLQEKGVYDCLARYLGLKYVYDESARQSKAESVSIPDNETIAALPEALRAELLKAIVSLDSQRIDEAVASVSEINPSLGRALEQHTSRLEYSVLLKLLQPVNNKHHKETV